MLKKNVFLCMAFITLTVVGILMSACNFETEEPMPAEIIKFSLVYDSLDGYYMLSMPAYEKSDQMLEVPYVIVNEQGATRLTLDDQDPGWDKNSRWSHGVKVGDSTIEGYFDNPLAIVENRNIIASLVIYKSETPCDNEVINPDQDDPKRIYTFHFECPVR